MGKVEYGQEIRTIQRQLGITTDDKIPTTVEEQTHLCFKNIEAVLKEAGATNNERPRT